MKACELMTPRPQVVTRDVPLGHAARLMRDHDIGMLPVVDSRSSLHPIGVITDRDITIRAVAEWRSAERNVEDFMTLRSLTTVSPDVDVTEVMDRMEADRVRRVLVVENGRLVGVIAQADLLRKQGPGYPRKVGEVLERISVPPALGV
jgi:CBS domain-containing protein